MIKKIIFEETKSEIIMRNRCQAPKTGVRTPNYTRGRSDIEDAKSKPKATIFSECAYWRCKKPFEPNPRQLKHDYCSPNCRKRAWDTKKILELAIKALQEFQKKEVRSEKESLLVEEKREKRRVKNPRPSQGKGFNKNDFETGRDKNQ